GHFLESAGQVLVRIGAVAAEPVAVGLGYALGRIQQTFTVGVIARPRKQGSDSGLGLLAGRLDGINHGSDAPVLRGRHATPAVPGRHRQALAASSRRSPQPRAIAARASSHAGRSVRPTRSSSHALRSPDSASAKGAPRYSGNWSKAKS